MNPADNNNWPIRRACEKANSAEFVRLLLLDPRVDPSAKESDALRSACRFNYTPVIELLVTDGRADPAARNYQILRDDLPNETILVLLKHPKLKDDLAVNIIFYKAVMDTNKPLIEALLQNKRINPAFCNNLVLRKLREKLGDFPSSVSIQEMLLKVI